MTFIVFLIMLGLLIISHEFGHFIVAKKTGVRVDEFAFGFPPRLFSKKRGETNYSINLLPIGGYVKIYGEDGEEGQRENGVNEEPRSFSKKPAYVRFLILVAGPLFNILLAWILITYGYISGIPASVSDVPNGAKISDPRIIVLEVAKNSPAEKAGVKLGDEIIGFSDIESFKNYIKENQGKEINLNIKREDKTLSFNLTPRPDPPPQEGATGVAVDEIGTLKMPFYLAPFYALKFVYEMTVTITIAIFSFLISLIKGNGGLEQIMGPVGLVGATSTAFKTGISYLLGFVAMVSINLAIINLFPFPALDGGRILFLAIEKIKGSPINQKFLQVANTIGMALLLILMLIITYRDILRLV